MAATSPPITEPLTDPQPRDVIALHSQVQALVQYVNSMHGTESRINGLIYDGTNALRMDLTAVQHNISVLTAQYQHFLTTPPNVIHIDAPQRTGGDNNKRTRSIMDTKGFVKMELFEGVGWNRWKSKFMTLARLAYPDAGLECLVGAAKTTDPICNDKFLVLDPVIDDKVQKEISVDIVATLGFLLKGEPHDILNNCTTNGLELWRRLEARYNLKTDSK